MLGTRGGIGDVPRGSACPAGWGCHLLIDVPAANAVPRISRGCHGSRKEKRGEKNKKAGKKNKKKPAMGMGEVIPNITKRDPGARLGTELPRSVPPPGVMGWRRQQPVPPSQWFPNFLQKINAKSVWLLKASFKQGN